MEFLEKLKKFNEEVSLSILGNYHVEFEKLRHLRMSAFALIVFIISLDIYIFFPNSVMIINKQIHYFILLIIFSIFLIIGITKFYKWRANKLRLIKKQSIKDGKKAISLLSQFLLIISLVSLIYMITLLFIASYVLLYFINISMSEALNIYLENVVLKFIILALSIALIYLTLSRLFKKEHAERGFTKSEFAINWFKIKVYKAIYLVTMILSTVIEFGLMYPLYFEQKKEVYTGCVKKRISLIKAKRFLLNKGYNFQNLPLYINNPRYIALFTGTKTITFHIDDKSRSTIINFGDYCVIYSENGQYSVNEIENILRQRG